MRVTCAYLFGLALTVLGLCPPATPARQPDNKAADPFQGTWQIVKMQLAGEDLSQFLKDAGATITFKNDTYAVKAGPEGEKGTFKFDAKAKPATIDLTIVEGPGKGKVQLGIYELDGDTLRLCLADEGAKERPTKFASAKGTAELVLFTLQRKKAEK